MIKREKIDASPFRQVLTALITSDEFINIFAAKFKSDFFEAKFAKIVCDWCLNFQKKYDQAPKSHIMDIYDEAVRINKTSEDELKLIEDLLTSLNGEYENSELNMEFLLDNVNKLQLKQDMKLLRDEIDNAIESNNLKHAENLIEEFQTFDPDDDECFNDEPERMLTDKETVDSIFSTNKEPLIKYSGALGELINNAFIRNSLVAFRMAPSAGKTWTLADITVKACQARLNVAYFQTGDLSRGQASERIFLNMSGIPRRPLKRDHFRPIIDCKKNQDDSCVLMGRESCGSILDSEGQQLPYNQIPKNYQPCKRCLMKNVKFPATVFKANDYTEEVMDQEVVKKFQRIFASRMKGKHFFSKTFPNESVNVNMISKLLRVWKKKHNFTPDFIIIDYADILKPETGNEKDEKTIIDKRYKALRRLGQLFNACVVVAEQKKLANDGMGGFVGSSTKNMHISDGFEGNASDDDKKNKVLRLNPYKRRDEEFDTSQQVVILQDLNRGIFHLDSYWAKDEYKPPVEKFEKKKKYSKQ